MATPGQLAEQQAVQVGGDEAAGEVDVQLDLDQQQVVQPGEGVTHLADDRFEVEPPRADREVPALVEHGRHQIGPWSSPQATTARHSRSAHTSLANGFMQPSPKRSRREMPRNAASSSPLVMPPCR